MRVGDEKYFGSRKLAGAGKNRNEEIARRGAIRTLMQGLPTGFALLTAAILLLEFSGCSKSPEMPGFPSAVVASGRIWSKSFEDRPGMWLLPSGVQKLRPLEFRTAGYVDSGQRKRGSSSVWITAYRMGSSDAVTELVQILPTRKPDRVLFTHADICVVCDAPEAGQAEAFCERLKSLLFAPKHR